MRIPIAQTPSGFAGKQRTLSAVPPPSTKGSPPSQEAKTDPPGHPNFLKTTSHGLRTDHVFSNSVVTF